MTPILWWIAYFLIALIALVAMAWITDDEPEDCAKWALVWPLVAFGAVVFFIIILPLKYVEKALLLAVCYIRTFRKEGT